MLTSLCIWFILIQVIYTTRTKKMSLTMPSIQLGTQDSAFCTSKKVNSTIYILSFEPKATMALVHHLLLFGCSKPGSEDPFWDCSELEHQSPQQKARTASICADDDPTIIYAWALNASSFHLPKNVAFEVAKNSHLVLQVHYTHKSHKNDRYISGLNLKYTDERQRKFAGILALASEGRIPHGSMTKLETSCEIRENKTVFPFAYRVHTHELGILVSGYRVHKNREGVERWFLLGKRNPQEAQTFYPVVNKKPVVFQDKLVGRCVMDGRSKSTDIFVGSGHDNEMCNFYLMYYVKKGKPLEMKYCISTTTRKSR